MSLTVSKGDKVTVITVTPNSKSKWPILCQILGTMCYSPVCSVAQDMKVKQTQTLTALGILQMIVGVINIVVGILFATLAIHSKIMMSQAPFWLGGVFLAIGILCILANKFPSPCLVVIAVILNIASAGLAIAAVVLYSVDLASDHNLYCYNYNYNFTTPSTLKQQMWKRCEEYKHLYQMFLGGLDIMMIVLSVLQLCVAISFCVLTVKSWIKKSKDLKSVEEPQLQPLLEDTIAIPAI
ncbi:uncharacterized protein [Misgurnus anguillicaudatus]|uniref:uncharacterized protein isoform X5 n=1 Tax=Misgurnus anguillicaudatus TaxID=75329 RepID=UPI003CCF0B22